MKEGIFISYRREGGSTFAGVLYSELCEHFAAENIFKDVNTLKPGSNFKKEIEIALECSSVFLVLIDNDWVLLKNEKGNRKLFAENDFVRHEIKIALERNLEIIPVLFENGSMPLESELPKILQPLRSKQSFTIHPKSVTDDIPELIEYISSKKKYKYEENTITGSYERLWKDPTTTLKSGWKIAIDRYKKDFTYFKGFLKKHKKKLDFNNSKQLLKKDNKSLKENNKKDL